MSAPSSMDLYPSPPLAPIFRRSQLVTTCVTADCIMCWKVPFSIAMSNTLFALMICATVATAGRLTPALFAASKRTSVPFLPSTTALQTSACSRNLTIQSIPFLIGLQFTTSQNIFPSAVLTAIASATFSPSMPNLMPAYRRPASFGNLSACSCSHSFRLIADRWLYLIHSPKRWMLKSVLSSPISERMVLFENGSERRVCFIPQVNVISVGHLRHRPFSPTGLE